MTNARILYNCGRTARRGKQRRRHQPTQKQYPSTFIVRQAKYMNFELSEKTKALKARLQAFMDEHIYPNEQRFLDEIESDRWKPARIIEELKPKARAAGLWNLFMPDEEN